jgi:hypothetical protein
MQYTGGNMRVHDSKSVMYEHHVTAASAAADETPPSEVRLSIVMLLKHPPPGLLENWIRHHKHSGFERLCLFFDDPEDPAIEEALPFEQYGVRIYRCDADWWKETVRLSLNITGVVEFIGQEPIARQIMVAEVAMRDSISAGIDWLLHIDMDELFYSASSSSAPLDHTNKDASVGDARRYFGSVPDDVQEINFINLEAAPESNVTDWMTEVVLFKEHPIKAPPALMEEHWPKPIWKKAGFSPETDRPAHYLGYQNGKSAARCKPGIVPGGCHAFIDVNDQPLVTLSPLHSGPVILHYIDCGFDNWWRKYQNLGHFPNKYFETFDCFEFHMESRDAIMNGDNEKALSIYKKVRSQSAKIKVQSPASVFRLRDYVTRTCCTHMLLSTTMHVCLHSASYATSHSFTTLKVVLFEDQAQNALLEEQQVSIDRLQVNIVPISTRSSKLVHATFYAWIPACPSYIRWTPTYTSFSCASLPCEASSRPSKRDHRSLNW